MIYYDDDPIYAVKTIDQRTQQMTYHFKSQNEREAKNYFRAMLPSVQSLKSYHAIQHDAKKYTEVLLIKTYALTIEEFPVWKGFVETKFLKK